MSLLSIASNSSAHERSSAPASMTSTLTPSRRRNAARYGRSRGGKGGAPRGNRWPKPPIESLLETWPGGCGGLTRMARLNLMTAFSRPPRPRWRVRGVPLSIDARVFGKTMGNAGGHAALCQRFSADERDIRRSSLPVFSGGSLIPPWGGVCPCAVQVLPNDFPIGSRLETEFLRGFP